MVGKKKRQRLTGERIEAPAAPSKPTRAPKKASPRARRGTQSPEKSAAARQQSGASKREPAAAPIVAIGASAGGLDAFKRFLAAAPLDSGMAFVLVPHLDPTHESLMVELLAKQTRMPVHEASEGMAIEPDHVYVIPPGKYLAFKQRKLVVTEPDALRGQQTAIDFALSSLAKERGEAAIGIILSGTGSHGTLGVKEIKLAGGMVMVQEPATAAYDQMPRSALATGLVDYVLPPEEMPKALITYARHGLKPPAELPDGLQRILALLLARVKQDFRHYRKKMMVRRIHRRMAMQQITSMDDYLEYLREHADEVHALYRDLLIGVTSFFRDPEAFAALAERVISKLVERATVDAPLRIWVPGCASGEEAYSIAIVLIEALRRAEKVVDFQIFATDVDEGSLQTARRGIYSDSIAGALSPERRQRFFVRIDDRHYQVNKELREAVVFAAQNLVTDPPFSRLDLISCRNVLIYLETEVQENIISLLHFALKPDGYLMLGPSESIGRAIDMFEPISKKWRLYRRIGPVRRDLVTIPIAALEGRKPRVADPQWTPHPALDFRALTQKLLAEEFAPASALINKRYEILSVQGPLVNYLEFPPGEITRDLLAMARDGLRTRIRSVCQKAIREGETVVEAEARVKRGGVYVPCIVTARPIFEPKEAEGLVLIVFQDRIEATSATRREAPAAAESSAVRQLEEELRTTREDLQSAVEELESSNEELKASNEEVMSMNEELQSANEELQTSKEELQSLNEELTTVNGQLEEKIDDLDATNNDLTNLMTATDIATVFVDPELHIKRYTPAAARLLALIAADAGRPFRDVAPRFRDDDLLQDLQRVMEKLTPIAKEVRNDDNRWYLRRILPYRAGDDRIGGAVITFVDVTPRMEAEAQALRLSTVLLDSSDAVLVCRLDGRIIAWNRAAERMYGYSSAEALGMNVRNIVPAELATDAVQILERAAHDARGEPFETRRRARDGHVLDVWVTVTVLKDDDGKDVAIAASERDISVRRKAEEESRRLNVILMQRIAERTAELEASEHRIRSILDAAVDPIISINGKGMIETYNAAAERVFGYSAVEVIGRDIAILVPTLHDERREDFRRRDRDGDAPLPLGKPFEIEARRRDGARLFVELSISEIGGLGLFTLVIHDLSEQKAMQSEILRIATLEQRRIGQELHDDTQQELTGLGLLAQNLSEELDGRGESDASKAAQTLAARIADANRRVRTLARGLVPVTVDAEGLASALAELARSTEENFEIACTLENSAPVAVADDSVATQMYRIAQEGVANAVKHAGASAIRLQLERGDRGLELTVRDDGVGVPERGAPFQGAGMRIMEHRCGLIGGKLTIRRQEGGGTVLSCVVPSSSEARCE